MPEATGTARSGREATLVTAAGFMAPTLIALVIPVSVLVGRAAIAVTLGLAVIALLASRPRLSWPFPHGVLKAIALAVGLVLAGWLPSLLASGHFVTSARTWLGVGALCAGTVALVAALPRQRVLSPALKVFLIGMSVALLFAVLSMAWFPGLVFFRPTVFTPDRVFKASASAVACAVPVMLLCGFLLGRRWLAVSLGASGLALAMIVQTHSRSALAGIAVGLLASAIAVALRRLGTARTLAITVPLLVLGAGIAASAVPWQVADTRFGDYHLRVPTWLVDAHRQVIWQFVWDRHEEKPWTGWGINTINTVPGADDLIPGLDHEYVPAHPHNWMMEVLAETGFVGLAPILAVVVAVACWLAGRWRRRGSPATLGGLSLWIIFWTSSLSNFSFWSAWWQCSMAVLVIVTVMCELDWRSRPQA